MSIICFKNKTHKKILSKANVMLFARKCWNISIKIFHIYLYIYKKSTHSERKTNYLFNSSTNKSEQDCCAPGTWLHINTQSRKLLQQQSQFNCLCCRLKTFGFKTKRIWWLYSYSKVYNFSFYFQVFICRFVDQWRT